MKKNLKSKLFFLSAALLPISFCNAENKDFSKLEETFTQFLQEQNADAPDEGKPESKKIVDSEDPEKKDVPDEGKPIPEKRV